MGLKTQPFGSFLGFGDGKAYGQGEYYFSQGMRKSQNGIMPAWKVTSVVDNTTLTDLVLSNWFAQALIGSSQYTFHVDSNGNIFQNAAGIGSWALAYKPLVTTHGNGLIGDQKGRLLYAMTRYLGMYDSSIASYNTGTITSTYGSTAIVGSGTAFTSAMVGSQIQFGGVWYLIASVADATDLTLATNALVGSAGQSYTINMAWNDQYKDFGASSLPSASDFRDSDTYEDWVIFCNGCYLALYNVTDSSFNAQGFSLPSNFKTVAVRSGATGSC